MVFTPEDYQRVREHFVQIDGMLHFILDKHGFLPPGPKRNLFATLIGSVIGQRIKFEKARNLRRALYLKCGTDDFTPEQIWDLGLSGLISCGIGPIPSETILRVAHHLLQNNLQLIHISDLKLVEEIKGIGPWTLGCTKIMHSLNQDEGNFDDTLLYSDLIIRRALKQLYGWTTKEQIIAGTQCWSPWKGILTVYLWKEFS